MIEVMRLGEELKKKRKQDQKEDRHLKKNFKALVFS